MDKKHSLNLRKRAILYKIRESAGLLNAMNMEDCKSDKMSFDEFMAVSVTLFNAVSAFEDLMDDVKTRYASSKKKGAK